MKRSAFAVGADAKKAVDEIGYCPDNVQEPIIAVAKMTTFQLGSAIVTYVVFIHICMVIVKLNFFVTPKVFITIGAVNTISVTVFNTC